MHRMRWASYLCPGLPQLLRQGTWTSLAVALGLAALLDLALLGTFAWSELFTPGVRNALWIALAAAWLSAALFSAGSERSGVGGRQPDGANDNFRAALNYYLKGNWFEAERSLAAQLDSQPRDLDARMLLATLLRHTGRYDEAQRQLATMEQIQGSHKWYLEIARERQALADAESEVTEPSEADEMDARGKDPQLAEASEAVGQNGLEAESDAGVVDRLAKVDQAA